ncbi:hypothetical protein PATY110618_06875 [Paenibacillus typhae]|uniref:Uncharacterized protein n=1 Tax=Paenibacillus typhae TaxID=1174501 RepID=A0A1G8Q852_9BACL|nr:hypothetical protein SAMN05216192_110187 [Paenibacillus typhae]
MDKEPSILISRSADRQPISQQLSFGSPRSFIGIRPVALSANAYDDYAYSMKRSDHIWDYFQGRVAAKGFRVSREDQVDQEDREGRDFQADFRGHRGEDQAADQAVLKHQRLHHRNSYRK